DLIPAVAGVIPGKPERLDDPSPHVAVVWLAQRSRQTAAASRASISKLWPADGLRETGSRRPPFLFRSVRFHEPHNIHLPLATLNELTVHAALHRTLPPHHKLCGRNWSRLPN